MASFRESESTPVREAAKILLMNPEGKLVLVSGESERVNGLGGGVETGQQITDALFEELGQEAGIKKDDVADLEPAGIVEGVIQDGQARWYLYSGRLIPGHRPLQIGAEIKALHFMTPEEAIKYQGLMSDLLRTAIKGRYFS